MDVTTAPKPHPVFESYVLTFSADKGLLAVSALGKDVPTNVFGEEVHSQFLELRAALSKIYGDPSLTAGRGPGWEHLERPAGLDDGTAERRSEALCRSGI